MIQKIKLLIILSFTATLGCVLFGTNTVQAAGEKWELIDSTTIRVSGGSFTGPLSGNGFTVDNPRSITLKLKSTPNTDPSIWEANQSFKLGTVVNGQPYYLEDTSREVGQFCVVANNFSLLLSGREAASFTPIHREDCNKPFGEMRFIESGNSQYNRCGNWGPVQGSRCNTLWASSQTAALSLDSKISYNIPGKPLVCGDPGFVGPCPQPYDPAKADCSKTGGAEGAQRQCEAIKECILDANKAAAECQKAWTECVASYGTETPNYNSCKSAIAKGDFEGGKKQVADDAPEDKTSCALEGVGWFVCPIAGFLGMMTDGLFGVLTTLLSFTPVQENEATYDTWQAMRNIANAAFVIAFLIIIFSQLTGAGITNYGIKKMVPRLIAAAILVNVSFFICQIAVDLSNILGYSLQSLMTNAAKTASGESNSLDVWGEIVGWILAGAAGTLTIGGTVLAITAAGGWIPALALLLPVLVTVLFAVLTVVLVLAARQALIIILIVISPLAFVAYLLPNTEDWFHKWRKLFITLLLMFPIISVIFGGSQLAAAVIRAGTNNPLIYILSLAVQVIPFFLVPIIMKTAGGLLNRFGGIVNNPNKGPFDKLRKSAQGYGDMQRNRGRANQLERYERDRQSGNKSTVGAVTRWQMRRRTEQTGVENVLKKAEAGYVAQQIKDSEEFRNKAAGGSRGNPASSAAQNAVLASAVSALDKMEDEEASNAEKLMRHGKDPNQMIDIAAAELTTAIQNNDVTKGLAAQRILRNSGNKGLDKLHATLESNVTTEQQKTSDVVRNLRSDINSAGLKGKNNVLTSWSYGAGTQTLADAASDPGTLSGLTDTELAGQSLDKALKAAPQGTISQTQAQSIIDNQNIWKDIDENKKAFFEQVAGRPSIHRQTTPTPSATPAAPTAPGFEQTDSGLFIPRDRE